MYTCDGDLLLGIDIGTTGTKCTVYNFNGGIEASAYQDYPMIHRHEGWAEQDPNIWWSCVCGNLKKCFSNPAIDNSRIAAIGLSCTNAVCLVDGCGNVLCNAISLHDQRSGRQVDWLEEKIGSKRIRELTANRLAPGSCALASIRWIIDNCSDIISPDCKFLSPSGFIIKRLTGEPSVSTSRANLACMSNIYSNQYEHEIIDRAEIPYQLLPPIYNANDIVGVVSRYAAQETGLRPGTPVTAGSVDTVAATLGSGALDVGDLAVTIGSSGRICYVSDSPNFDDRIINAHTINNNCLVIQTTNNAGVSLRWFRDTFGRAAYSGNEYVDGNIYKRIDEAAETVGAGADGMIYLPYLAGEKSPIWDPNARGVFFNIGLNSSFGSFARAVLEGVAFSIRDCANAVSEKCGGDVPIPLGGGIANSKIWCQIFADVFDRPILRLKTSETETLGDIIAAADAIGISDVPLNFGKILAKQGEILYPHQEYRSLYDDAFFKYKELYAAVSPLF